MPGGGTRKQQCGAEWLGSASCGQDPVKHGVIRRWIVMGELLGGLLDDPMLTVGIVPDDASKVDTDVLAGHVIENLVGQIHIGRVRDECQAIDHRGWPRGPRAHGGTFGKDFLYPDVGSGCVGFSHHAAGDAEPVSHDVRDQVGTVVVNVVVEFVGADLFDVPAQIGSQEVLREVEHYASCKPPAY